MSVAVSQLPCPRCHAALYVGSTSHVTLHGCGGCGGVWLGKACVQQLMQKMPADALQLAQRASAGARHAAHTGAPAHCPVCRKVMQRTTAAAARVELDTCAEHGTWYDRDEILAITAALKQSGWHAAPTQPIQPTRASRGSSSDGFADAAGAVAVGVGTEVAVEGVFGLLFAFFD